MADRPVCLVTGAARRLGAAIVEHLADEFDVAIHYNGSQEDAAGVAKRCEAKGAKAAVFQADLADAGAAAHLVRDVRARMARLDLLVSSASRFEYDAPSEFDAEKMQALLAINLVAPMVMAREFASVGAPDATLVCLLDNKVYAPNPDFFSYSLGKLALSGAMDMLALHFAGRMRVCAVAPGLTLRSGEQTEEAFRRDWTRTLTGRGATPSDIAETVSFIWRTKSLNAETIVLDGGQHLMRLPRDVAFMQD